MMVLPIVGRELRVAARRRGTYWSRAIAAFVAIVIMGWILLLSSREEKSADLGKLIFGFLSAAGGIYCLLIGALNTADCVSEEKREGTLGLLFLTDLKGYDVSVGKLVATSMNSVYGLLAMFPVLAVPLLLGGTTVEQFETMMLALANTLFLSLTVGLWVSTLGREEMKTTVTSVLIMIFFAAGLPLLAWAVSAFLFNYGNPELVQVIMLPSPSLAIFFNIDSSTKPALDPHFWGCIATVHVMGWAFFLLASARLPKVWQDKADTIQKILWRERWMRWSLGDSAERKSFRTRLIDKNPFYWLAARARLKPSSVWAFLGISACLWLWGWVEMQRNWIDDFVCVMTTYLVMFVLKLWLALEASRRLSEDRQSGALELLLSTPLAVEEIIRGQWLALRRQFFGPVVTVSAVTFLFLLMDANDASWVFWSLVQIVVFVADMYAMGWVGMWLGLKSKHGNRAAGLTIVRIMILPLAAYCALITFLALTSTILHFNTGSQMFTGLWLVTCIVNNAFWVLRARGKLLSQFRTVVTQRFDPSQHVDGDSRPVAAVKPPAPPVLAA